jgi:hypothetical protein
LTFPAKELLPFPGFFVPNCCKLRRKLNIVIGAMRGNTVFTEITENIDMSPEVFRFRDVNPGSRIRIRKFFKKIKITRILKIAPIVINKKIFSNCYTLPHSSPYKNTNIIIEFPFLFSYRPF